MDRQSGNLMAETGEDTGLYHVLVYTSYDPYDDSEEK